MVVSLVRRAALALLLIVAGTASGSEPPAAFAASFVQTRTLPGFDAPIVSHGVMRFSRDGGFRWEITRPYHYVFAMHDGRAREELPDGTERELDADATPWLAIVQRIFVNALSGQLQRLDAWFEVHVTPVADGRQVTLVPKTDAMGQVMKRIEVLEDRPGQPRELRIDETGGGRMTVLFTPLATGTGSP